MSTSYEMTWAFDGNRAVSATETVKNGAFALKALMKGDVGSPSGGQWTTYYSCDGATAGTAPAGVGDGVDRWTTSFDGTKIVHAAAGVAHSWFVLKSPVSLGPVYLIIDCLASPVVNLVISKAAPTGGSTTARPTATDEIGDYYTSMRLFNANGASKVHGGLTTNGDFYFLTSVDATGSFYAGVVVQSLADARSGSVDLRSTVMMLGTRVISTPLFTLASLQNASNSLWRARNAQNTQSVNLQPAYLYTGATNFFAAMTTTDAADSKYDDMVVYAYCATLGHQSIRGRLKDIRFCPTGLSDGSVDPASGTAQAFTAGIFWFPGNFTPSL